MKENINVITGSLVFFISDNSTKYSLLMTNFPIILIKQLGVSINHVVFNS